MVDQDIEYWLVGSIIDGVDKTDEFIKNGYWEHGFDHKYIKRIKTIKAGDKIAIKSSYVRKHNLPFDNHGKAVSVMKIKAIGTVTKNNGDGKKIYVNWDKNFIPKELYGFSYRNTCSIIDKTKWEKPIEWIFNNKPQDEFWLESYQDNTNGTNNTTFTNPTTKNIILYGPPGVGKTYNHKKLITLIESGILGQKEIFESIRQNEDIDLEEDIDTLIETIKNENRMQFVTFHQSYSYEDFIEGFRPSESGNIELHDGIFKQIATLAHENIENSQNESILPFSQALEILLKPIDEGKTVRVDMKRAGSHYTVYDYTDRTVFFHKQKGSSEHSLSVKTLENMYKTENVHKIRGGMFSYYQAILNKLLEIKHNQTSTPQPLKNFYLVIDEINRGNISKIFGELITLIEEDKRDQIAVTLPYSKEPFSVPSNLYIIATMNSTDKSIALIDIALRRRFTFLKMQPDSNLISNEKAKNIFVKLNEIIQQKLGAEYLLGHSYFMGEDIDLEFILEYKIKPLLEEYFYADEKSLEEIIQILPPSAS